jgi:arsenite-transporting ATPase
VQGCDALRALRSSIRRAEPAPAQQPHGATTTTRAGTAESWISSLNDKLIWVAGKGGVGKSTCAAAIAVLLSETRRVSLVSTDPAGSLTEVLGVPVTAEPTRLTTDAPSSDLTARQIDAVAEFNRMRSEYESAVDDVFRSLGLESSAALDRRVVESLWDFAPPGIDEIISLIEILDQADNYDTLVIDSAPTGHFLRLIQMPDLALDWVHALLRLLVKYSAAASLDALAQQMLGFAKRLRQLKLDLSTPGSTAVFIVTLAEAMVEAETARLSSTLEQAGVPLTATILNRADDGEGGSSHKLIRAPDQHREIVGAAMLRSFIAQWSLGEEHV